MSVLKKTIVVLGRKDIGLLVFALVWILSLIQIEQRAMGTLPDNSLIKLKDLPKYYDLLF